eukprot:12111023-Alexandrium_andersonii.AAC.1
MAPLQPLLPLIDDVDQPGEETIASTTEVFHTDHCRADAYSPLGTPREMAETAAARARARTRPPAPPNATKPP